MLIGTAVITAVAAALYLIAKKGVAGAAAGAVGAAADVASGAVVGIGQIFGIPATNETECERAKREGRTLDASFACPAGDFIGWAWRDLVGAEGAGQQYPTTGDLARADRQLEQSTYTGGASGGW